MAGHTRNFGRHRADLNRHASGITEELRVCDTALSMRMPVAPHAEAWQRYRQPVA